MDDEEEQKEEEQKEEEQKEEEEIWEMGASAAKKVEGVRFTLRVASP